MSSSNPYNTPSDEQCRLQILDRLQHDSRIDSSKMEVEVRNAVAIIKGKADTEAEKMLTEEVAASVEGIQSVENHLIVEIGLAHALSSLAAHIQGDIIRDDEEDNEEEESK